MILTRQVLKQIKQQDIISQTLQEEFLEISPEKDITIK